MRSELKKIQLRAREKDIERELVRRVNAAGGRCFKLLGYIGIPDRMVLMPGGRICFIELKRPGGVLSEAQIVFINSLKHLGFPAYVVDSVESIAAIIGA